MDTNWMKLEFPSESVNVQFARTTVAIFASQLDFTLEEIEEIKVAVSEAVSNSVIHGYSDSQGNIIMKAEYTPAQFTVSVEDFGRGIPDIVQAQESGYTTVPEERMGIGLYFIHEYMDKVSLHSEVGKGTKIVMVKTVKPIQG